MILHRIRVWVGSLLSPASASSTATSAPATDASRSFRGTGTLRLPALVAVAMCMAMVCQAQVAPVQLCCDAVDLRPDGTFSTILVRTLAGSALTPAIVVLQAASEDGSTERAFKVDMPAGTTEVRFTNGHPALASGGSLRILRVGDTAANGWTGRKTAQLLPAPNVSFVTTNTSIEFSGSTWLQVQVSRQLTEKRSFVVRQIAGERRSEGGELLPFFSQEVWMGPDESLLTVVRVNSLSEDSTFVLESGDFLIHGSSQIVSRFEKPKLFVQNAGSATSPGRRAFMIIPLERRDRSSREVVAEWRTEDDTARAGQDYVSTNGVLVFQPGESSKALSVEILPGARLGTSLRVLFSNSNAQLGAPSATLSISPTVYLAASEFQADEAGHVRVEVEMSHPQTRDIEVYVAGFPVVIASGSTNAVLELRLEPGAGPPTIGIVTTASAYESGVYPGQPSQARLLLPGWNAATPTIFVRGGGAAAGHLLPILLARTGPATQPLTVQVRSVPETALPGLDYLPLDQSVTLRPDERETLLYVETLPTAAADSVTKSFLLEVSGPVRVAGSTRNHILPGARYSIDPRYTSETSGMYLASRDWGPGVRYFTSDGSARAGVHYEPSSGTLQRYGFVRVPVFDDDEVNGPRTFFINFVSLSDPVVTNRHPVTILDNEAPDNRDPDFVSEALFGSLGHAGLVRRDDTIVWHHRGDELIYFASDGRIQQRRALQPELEPGKAMLAEMPDERSLLVATGGFERFPELQILQAEGAHRIFRADLPSGRITALHVSREGKVWLAMDLLFSGLWLYRLDPDGRRETAVLVEKPWSWATVGQLAERDSGALAIRLIRCGRFGCSSTWSDLIGSTLVPAFPEAVGPGLWLGSDAQGRSLFEVHAFNENSPVYSWVRFGPDGTADPAFISGRTVGMQYLGTQSDGDVIALKMSESNQPGAARLVRLPRAQSPPPAEAPTLSLVATPVTIDAFGNTSFAVRVSRRPTDSPSFVVRQIAGERRGWAGESLPLFSQEVWIRRTNDLVTTVLVDSLSEDSIFTVESGDLSIRGSSQVIARFRRPEIAVPQTPALANPGGRATLTIPIQRWDRSSRELVVEWRTEDDTARAARDYVGTTGLLVFQPGEREKTLSVDLLPNARPGTSFRIMFSSSDVSLTGAATVSIAPTVFFTATEFQADEAGSVQIGLELSHPHPRAIQVAVGGVVVEVPAGRTNAVVDLKLDPEAGIPPQLIRLGYPQETSMDLGSLDPGFRPGHLSEAMLLPPGWNATTPTITVRSRGGHAGSVLPVALSRTGPLTQPLTVHVRTVAETAVAGLDYLPLDRSLTFGPGEAEARLEIHARFRPGADPATKSFLLEVSGPVQVVGSTRSYIVPAPDPITFWAVEGGSMNWTARDWTGSESGRSVRYFTSDGSARAGVHYQSRSGTLSGRDELRIPILDNAEVNAPRTFFIHVSVADHGVTNRHAVTILDNAIPDVLDPGFVSELFPSADLGYQGWNRMGFGQAGLIRRDDTIVWHNAHANELVHFAQDGRILQRQPLPSELRTIATLAEMPDDASLLAATGALEVSPQLRILGSEGIRRLETDLPSGRITALHASRDGKVWVGLGTPFAGQWIYRLDTSGRRNMAVHVVDRSEPTLGIRQITEGSSGVLDLRLVSCSKFGCGAIRAQVMGETPISIHSEAKVVWLGSDALGRSLFEVDRYFPERTWVRYQRDGTVDPTFISGPTWGMQYLGTQSDGDVIALKSEHPFISPGPARLVRLPPPAPQKGRFVVVAQEAREGPWDGGPIIQVIRTGSTATTASVRLRTIDLTAQAGVDYEAVDLPVVFAPFALREWVTVPVSADNLLEGTEMFRIELLEPDGAELTQSSWDIPLVDGPALALVLSDAGAYELAVRNPEGVALEIQSSSDLQDWTTLEVTSARSIIRPLTEDHGRQRFYRVMRQP